MPKSNTIEEMHRFHAFLDNAATVFFSWIPIDSWPVEYVSKSIDQFGYSVDEFLSGDIRYADIIFKEDLERVAKEVEEHTKNSTDRFNQEYRIVTADKTVRWVDDHTIVERNSDGTVKNYLGVVIDITDKKVLQQKLQQSEEKFRTIAENSQMGIFIYQEKFIYVNQALCDQSGYSFEELYRMNIWDFADDSFRDQVKEIVLKRYQGKLLGKQSHDFKFICKNGEVKIVRTMVQTIKYNGAYAGIGTIMDITDIIETKQTLGLLAQAIEQTDDMVRITKRDGTIIFVNDSAVEHSGYKRTELLGETPRIFKSGEHDEHFYQNMWSTILDGVTYKGTVINKKKSGHLYYEEETITPINDQENNVQYFVVTGKDITQRIEIEHELTKRATIDSLTGVYNRQKCSEQLDVEMNRYTSQLL